MRLNIIVCRATVDTDSHSSTTPREGVDLVALWKLFGEIGETLRSVANDAVASLEGEEGDNAPVTSDDAPATTGETAGPA